MDSDAAAMAFADGVEHGRFDAVIFLTGVGIRALLDPISRAGRRQTFVDALARQRVIVRGPKPQAVLRELQVPVWLNAPEPNTWRDLVAALDAKSVEWSMAGKRLALQEYGVSNADLIEALRVRGAVVTAVQAYQWAMPEDIAPLQAAARELAAGAIDVLLVTTGVQVTHFWQVVSAMGLEADVRRSLSKVLIASIGPTASAELRRHGLEPAFEPSHPKMGFLVREAAERG
jgi:uroporphyrinogen-III synthase